MSELALVNSEYSPSADAQSPVAMDFADAMGLIADGKQVTRLEWADPDVWLLLFMMSSINLDVPAARYLCIHKARGTVQPLFVSAEDIKATDWIEVA